jgi:tripartite-type tricarboxylate transporter receptor subunit TctC
MPADGTGKLQKAIQIALETTALKERLKSLDITPAYADGKELHARVVRDVKNWGAFIKDQGLKGQ